MRVGPQNIMFSNIYFFEEAVTANNMRVDFITYSSFDI